MHIDPRTAPIVGTESGTLFTTPAIRPLLRAAARAFLRLSGWKVEGALEESCRNPAQFADR